jgi:hypothetical protein
MSERAQTQAKQSKPVSFTPVLSGVLQRKCASCGNHTVAGGECAECSKNKLFGLQTKLKVNEPGDIYEQEADRIANQVMATPVHSTISSVPSRIQRFVGQTTGQTDMVPASVDQALASPGRPLEPLLRQDMEQRFGYDFSRVRIHSGATAERSARATNAYAYTVGHDIVFGAGRFSPGTNDGRRLIAHELTHVVQQTGYRDAIGIDPLPVQAFSAGPMLARACDPLACPLVKLPLGIFVPSWQLAEKCLQDHYQKRFPSHTVGYNKDWVGKTGKNKHERRIINCLRPHFTAKGYKPKEEPEEEFKPEEVEREGSRQRQAEPDIFDFTNLTIMEITTPNPKGLSYRIDKVAGEVRLANQLMGECGIGSPNLWQMGWWSPEPCYQVVGTGTFTSPEGIIVKSGKLFFRTWRVGGVLVYVPELDFTREAFAVAAATVAVSALKYGRGLLSGLGSGLAPQVAPAGAGAGGAGAALRVPLSSALSGGGAAAGGGSPPGVAPQSAPPAPAPGAPPASAPGATSIVPEPVPKTFPGVKGPGVPPSAVRAAVTGISLNVLLFAVTYYLNKWHAEEQVRKFNNDLKGLLPEINTRLKNKETEIVAREKAFPLVYGNITIVYTHEEYAPEDYNEGSMSVQDVTISHQNYQTPENVFQFDPLRRKETLYSLTFSVPLFEEKTIEPGTSSLVRDYRRERENLTHSANRVRLSAVIRLYKLATQDPHLETLVVRDLLGMLKDRDGSVQLSAAFFLSRLKAKIGIQYIREVMQITKDDKQKKLIQSFLSELEQG